MSIKIYDSKSQLSRPKQFIQGLVNDLESSKELATQLFIMDLKAQYRQTLLGFIWLIIPPIVFGFGFSMASKAGVLNFGETDIPYTAYVIISMVLWQTFVEALVSPLNAFKASQAIIVKVSFPHEALIFAKLINVLVNFIPKIILIIIVVLIYGIDLKLSIFLAIGPLFNLIILGLFTGVIITPFAALYNDLYKAIIIIAGAWLCITPVVYPLPEIAGIFSMLVNINPATYFLVATRELLTVGYITDGSGLLLASIFTYVGFILSWIIYKLSLPIIRERISS